MSDDPGTTARCFELLDELEARLGNLYAAQAERKQLEMFADDALQRAQESENLVMRVTLRASAERDLSQEERGEALDALEHLFKACGAMITYHDTQNSIPPEAINLFRTEVDNAKRVLLNFHRLA